MQMRSMLTLQCSPCTWHEHACKKRQVCRTKHMDFCQLRSWFPQVGDAGNSEGLSGLNYYTNTFDHRAPQQHTPGGWSSSC